MVSYQVDECKPQSDKIWRIDLQDDHESCQPVDLRMTLKSLIWPWNPQDDPQNPVILSSCRSTGQYDQIISRHSGVSPCWAERERKKGRQRLMDLFNKRQAAVRPGCGQTFRWPTISHPSL